MLPTKTTTTDGFGIMGFFCSVFTYWCPVFICELNRVAPTPPLSHDPLPPRRLPRLQEGEAGFRWHARAELSTALLATARPALLLLQPARSGCHGSQVSSYPSTPPPSKYTHTIDSHPLRAPPKLQHYPHLLHYYALLSPCSSVIFSHISPPFVCSFPEQNMGNPNSRRIDRSVFVLLCFFLKNV